MHRFFVSPTCIDGHWVDLPGDVARQLRSVLRARAGEKIMVLDDTGWEYLVSLDTVSAERVAGSVVARTPSSGEPGVVVTLYQAVLKADRFEFVLQKGTELGVSRFVPTYCARSVPRVPDEGRAASRSKRWRRIVTEAAEQSHRGRLPLLDAQVSFAVACDAVEGLAVIPWERERAVSLRTTLKGAKSRHGCISALSVFIGPEGGFSEEEIDLARSRGIVPVSLGNRVLRSETAGLATVTAVLYELGELGG